MEKKVAMPHMTEEEREIIRNAHLRGTCIVVIAHAPQQKGGCHPFNFMRGVLPTETPEAAFERVKPDILAHIKEECGRPCACSNGEAVIGYRIFGLRI